MKFMVDKEALFRRLVKWAAVTNAPKSNAELLISILKLQDFLEVTVLAEECALNALKVSPNHTFVFQDSVSGIKAANGAGMAAVGMATRNPEQMLLVAGASLVIKDYNDPKLWECLQEMVQQKLPI